MGGVAGLLCCRLHIRRFAAVGCVLSAHTPGPWVPCGVQKEEVRDYNGYLICKARANDALPIAALPDLIDACLTLLAWDEAENNAEAFDKDQGKAWRERQALCAASFDKARAAIAKATGEQA